MVPPTTIVVRLATVGPLSGIFEVSFSATSTSSNERPSASAAICENTVIVPCPMSVETLSTRTPRLVSSTPARGFSLVSPEPVKPAP